MNAYEKMMPVVILMNDFMASEEKGLLESRIGFLVLRACKIFILLLLPKVCEFMPVYSIHYISFVREIHSQSLH